MTTIATDGYSIAWDSCTDMGSRCIVAVEPKVLVLHGAIIATSGDACITKAVADWWHDGLKPEAKPDGEWRALIISKTHGPMLYFTDTMPKAVRGVPVRAPFAIGSGADIALGAMGWGANALNAVKLTAKFNAFTRPPFHHLNIKNALSEA